MFEGSMVALVTPVKGGAIDFESIENLIEFHIEHGTDVIVPCGCTGEAATLAHDEQMKIMEFVVEHVRKRVQVIPGTGSNSTQEALELTRHAHEIGADGALMISPYYNKPTPAGVYAHYKTVAEAVPIPIILYNVPSRTGISMKPETVAALSEIDNIVAIKEASGSMDQISSIAALCDITILSGDDSMTFPILSVGGRGVISVVANVVPDRVAKLVHSFLDGDIATALDLHKKMLPLCKAMFIETNPLPVKKTLSLLGMIENEFRLPLVPLSKDKEPELIAVLKQQQVLS
jgi:4-hydroxy-tetrahydrodipicolinate synthase